MYKKDKIIIDQSMKLTTHCKSFSSFYTNYIEMKDAPTDFI